MRDLPAQPSPLMGRGLQLQQAEQRLLRSEVRLLTLTGPPGIGKTCLAVAVADDLARQFRHGASFIDLSPLVDSALVASTIARALRVEPHGRPVLESLIQYLRDRESLLLLDNFERLLPAAPQMAELLASCPGLKLLATSRQPLRLRWEHLCVLPPLELPDPAHLSDPDRMADCPSVALFMERARAVKPDFALLKRDAPVVAEICRRLDGIPLAIELAATETAFLRPREILKGLRQRGFNFLADGPQDLPERQRTLRGAVDWSYAMLEPEEQRMLRCLAIFEGGCTPEAARTVCACEAGLGVEVPRAMGALVRKNLLRLEEVEGDQRLRLLEIVREYALEQLASSGEMEATRDRHAAHFLSLVEQAEPHLSGPDGPQWLDRLEREHENLRCALRRLGQRGEEEPALRLISALGTPHALQPGQLPKPRPQQENRPGVPSKREREVAVLIARGLTNRQIAAELVISERTVDTHVAKIMRKLGLSSRAQVAVWMAQEGLLTRRPS